MSEIGSDCISPCIFGCLFGNGRCGVGRDWHIIVSPPDHCLFNDFNFHSQDI